MELFFLPMPLLAQFLKKRNKMYTFLLNLKNKIFFFSLVKFPLLKEYALLFYEKDAKFKRFFQFEGYYMFQIFLRFFLIRFIFFFLWEKTSSLPTLAILSFLITFYQKLALEKS